MAACGCRRRSSGASSSSHKQQLRDSHCRATSLLPQRRHASSISATGPRPASTSPTPEGPQRRARKPASSPPEPASPAKPAPSQQDLKLKYSSLLQRQVSSHAGFILPSAAAAGAQPSQQQQQQQQPGSEFVHATPLPSVREDMRIRFKLQEFMADHATQWPEPAPWPQQQAVKQQAGPHPAPENLQPEQEQEQPRRQRRQLFPAQGPLFTSSALAAAADDDGPSTSRPAAARPGPGPRSRIHRRFLPPPPTPAPRPPVYPGAPAPAPRPRTDLLAVQLPSMLSPKGRRVAPAVRRRLLRLRSADYDLAARRGFGARLDRLVLEQQRGLRLRRSLPAAAAAPAAPQAPQAAALAAPGAAAAAAAAAPEGAWGQYYPGVEAVDSVVQRLLRSEAGLPSKAFYGRRGEQLASLSPETAASQIGVWLDIAGPDYTMRFLEKEPTLLTRHPGWLLQGLETFNQVLGLEPGPCLQFALKNSALLGTTREQLQGVVDQISSLLGLPLPDARRLVLRNTTLVTAHGSLSERLENLATLLPVSRPRLAAILRQRPALLTQSPTRLALALAALGGATGLPLFNASLLAAAQPGLLGLGEPVVRGRFQRLSRLAAAHAPWAEQLRDAPPAALARCLVASDAAIERLAACLAAWGAGAAPPSASGLKLHRVLSMTDEAFAALLADVRREAGAAGSAGAAKAAPERRLPPPRRSRLQQLPIFDDDDADMDEGQGGAPPPHPSSLRVLGEAPSLGPDGTGKRRGAAGARDRELVGS